MQITLDLPDSLVQSDSFARTDWMREIAIALFRQERIALEQASQIAEISIDEFYQILVNRNIPVDPDDEPNELVLESIRLSLQQISEGKIHPISELWEGIDV